MSTFQKLSTSECHVCGTEVETEKLSPHELVEGWNIFSYPFENWVWNLLVCPDCSKLGMDQVWDQYKIRIKKGFVQSYC